MLHIDAPIVADDAVDCGDGTKMLAYAVLFGFIAWGCIAAVVYYYFF